jgi:hypothetical protein
MMPLGPDEMARRIQHRHGAGWLVWFGRQTGQYWAMARWARTSGGMFSASSPDALETAIVSFELLHPAPEQRYGHVVDHRRVG